MLFLFTRSSIPLPSTESEHGETRQSQSLKRGSSHLVKRPSVDSGINLGSVQSVQSACDSLSSLRSLRSNRHSRDNSRISRYISICSVIF